MNQSELRVSLRIITTWLLTLGASLWMLDRNRNFIFLLLLAWLFAVAMEPAIHWLTRRGMKRGGATGVTIGGVVIFGAAFFAAFGGILLSQASSLVSSLPDIITSAVNWANSVANLNIDPQRAIDALDIKPSQLATIASHLAGGFLGFVSMVLGGVFQMLTMLLFAFYFAAEGPKMQQAIAGRLSAEKQEHFAKIWDIVVDKTGGFVVSKLAMAAISTLFHAIAFALIGVPYWLPMALITGIVGQFIPTVGTYLGILIPVLFTVFDNSLHAVWIVIFAAVYQQVENYVISPRISRMTMDIHPAIAFGSVIVFANLFGALGALIAIPLAAAIVAIAKSYGKKYELIDDLKVVDHN